MLARSLAKFRVRPGKFLQACRGLLPKFECSGVQCISESDRDGHELTTAGLGGSAGVGPGAAKVGLSVDTAESSEAGSLNGTGSTFTRRLSELSGGSCGGRLSFLFSPYGLCDLF